MRTQNLVDKIEFERSGHTFIVGVDDLGDIRYSIDGGRLLHADKFDKDMLKFYIAQEIEIDGKLTRYGGLKLNKELADKFSDISNNIKTDIQAAIQRENEQNLAAVMDGDNSIGYLTIEHTMVYGIYLGLARRLNDSEKDGCSEWFRDRGFVRIAPSIKLNYIDFRELPHRESDGEFRGCTNTAWIISPDEWNFYLNLNKKREDEESERIRLEKKAQYEKEQTEKAERDSWFKQFDSYQVYTQNIVDEGGETTRNIYTFTIRGETLRFVERNVFDFGVVINPHQSDKTGLAMTEDGVWVWNRFKECSIPMTDNEIVCVKTIAKYGKFSHARVRM